MPPLPPVPPCALLQLEELRANQIAACEDWDQRAKQNLATQQEELERSHAEALREHGDEHARQVEALQERQRAEEDSQSQQFEEAMRCAKQ